jgi:glyoxylase-like metal-dependent hydrolase (beta-lactamase superfamily II)
VFVAVRRIEAGSVDGNTLFIVNDSDVVVVDTGLYASDARQLIAEIRKRTAKPVRYVINTHHHGDHTLGNQAYLEAFPGVEFIGQTRTRDLAFADGPLDPKPFRTEIAGIDAVLANGKGSDGVAFTPERRAHLLLARSALEFWIEDSRSTPRIPPTLTFTDQLILYRGERRIEVRFLGRGHTAGDTVVYLPRERILATGDLVVQPIPFGGAEDFHEWPATLRALRKLDAVLIVPGHGEIQRDWNYVDRQIALLDATWEQVKKAVDAGANLEAARKAVDGEVLGRAFGIASAKDRKEFEYLYLDPAIEAIFTALRPELAPRPGG